MKNAKQPRNKTYFENYLYDFNSNLPKSMNKLVGVLSGGEQQALVLSLACLSNPQILLLDEHTSALDPKTGQAIMDFTAKIIREKKLTCIMTTHNLDYALNYGNRLLAINNGQLVFNRNKVEEPVTKEILLDTCY